MTSTSQPSTKTSWIMMVLALGSLVFLAVYIPHNRQESKRILVDFRVEIPPFTQWMLSIPDTAFPISAVIGAALVIFVQRWGRGSIHCASFHLFTILAGGAVYIFYRQSMFEPYDVLIRTIRGPNG